MRRRALIAFIALAGALAVWLWLDARSDSRSSDGALTAPDLERERSGELPLHAALRDDEPSTAEAVRTEAAAKGALPTASIAERARTTAGILVRVVDRSGTRLAGVPVRLRRELELNLHPQAPPPAPEPERLADFLSSAVARAASRAGSVPVLGQLPIVGQSFFVPQRRWWPPDAVDATPSHFVELLLTDERGDVLFAREAGLPEERWYVEPGLPCTPGLARLVPAGVVPAFEVELVLDGLRRIEVAASADVEFAPAPWHVHIHAERLPTTSDKREWTRWDATESFAAGTALELAAETTARVLVEAWQEVPFFPRVRVVLEADATPGAVQRVVLDAREHAARLRLVLALSDGRRPGEYPYEVVLWDGEQEHVCDLDTRDDSSMGLYLDARAPLKAGAHITFATHAKTAQGEREAYLELRNAHAPGATYDYGILVLGTGPVLYSGEVVDEEGSVIALAQVHCAERRETTFVDERGHFVQRGVSREAELTLLPEARGYFARPRQIAPGSSGLRLAMQRSAIVAGRLRVPAVFPADSVEPKFVSLNAEDAGRQQNGEGRADGIFELDGLPPGAGALSFERAGVVLRRIELELEPGRRDLGEVDLREDIALVEIRVLATDGAAASGVDVEFHAYDADVEVVSLRCGTDAAGRVTCWYPRTATRWTAKSKGTLISGARGEGQGVLHLDEH